MVPPLERTDYMYELRNIAENIVRERLDHFSVQHPVHSFQRGEVQVSFHENEDMAGNASASEDPQPPPHEHAPIDFSSTPGGSQDIPAYHIQMT